MRWGAFVLLFVLASSVVAATCDERPTLHKRVSCRQETPSPELVPEACMVPGKQDACVDLYRRSWQCYTMSGLTKNTCFREQARFTSVKNADDISKCDYLILLLRDLQERVEDAHDDGSITLEQAADLITSIAQIQRQVLRGEPASSIKSTISGFKQNYRGIMR